MSVRGHALVWHDQNPGWLAAAATDRDTAIELLREHITTVVGRYAGRVDQWDVVNEPLAIETNGDLHDSIWLEMIGPEYIDLAFEFARAADPTAELFINEFDGVSPGTKTDRLITLASELQARGVEIDGVGFEFHVLSSVNFAAVEAKLDMVADLGLRVALTEVDNGIRLPVTAEKIQEQADIFAGLLQACLNVSTCDTFVMWGFTDRHSWIPSTFSGYADATIHDTNIEPKPAFHALQDVLAS
jgi:endo-1,4-beta-xylanase